MGDSVNDHWSCSIRLDEHESADRIFDEQIDFVRDLLTQWFPASCGYQTSGTRLGGPLDGVCWSTTRGPFMAELGVQRFVRARSGDAPPAHELRFVANAGHGDACAVDSGLERRVVGWAIVGWGLGSAGMGALWLGSQGLLTGWAQVMLLVPVVATWRATMTRLAQRAGHTAALPAERAPIALTASPTAPPTALQVAPQVVEGLRRWRLLLPALAARREQLESVCGSPPFRSLGHAPGLEMPRCG